MNFSPSFTLRESYTATGNIFSQMLLLEQLQKEEKDCVIIVPQNTKTFLRIAEYLKIPLADEYTLSLQYYEELKEEGVCFFSFKSLSQYISPKLKKIELKCTQEYSPSKLIEDISSLGYSFDAYGKVGSYKKLGDTLSVKTSSSREYILSFWGDTLEEIRVRSWAGDILISDEAGESCSFASQEKLIQEQGNKTLAHFLQEEKRKILFLECDFCEGYESLKSLFEYSLSFDILPPATGKYKKLQREDIHISSLQELKEKIVEASDVSFYTKKPKLLEEFLHLNADQTSLRIFPLSGNPPLRSFQKDGKSLIICDDILQNLFIKRRIKKKFTEDIDLLLKIKNGDYIVHIDHGIGIFQSIVEKQLGTIKKEYLEIHYQEGDKLFVPITEVGRVSKFIGDEHPKLTALGGKVWEKKIAKIREDIQKIAEEILETFAKRKLETAEKLTLYRNEISAFQQDFPYAYTEDQENAIEEILEDMQVPTPMERLLVGDVGFGKTEVAFNAIFHAWTNKKQSLLLSPLVVLAYEHFEKALERFANFGITIEIVTRLTSIKELSRIKKGVQMGKIDCVIGTHRLLSDGIEWKDLGLIVIDEEHKFGVSDKEKIKNLRAHIHVLSLSATPIPRSLNLALSGIRQISLLKQAPRGRKDIETLVTRFDERVIQEAGEREFARAGQVFFIHNRVMNIEVFAKQLQKLFPGKKVVITHGQLPGEELEERILDFKHKKYDILLSTTVIENGIDFSNVNTIFINECQNFGISQIHQLRGRVGRSDRQGYCYLLYKKEHIDGEAAKRLRTIAEYSYLGAGFELAMKDLEIRGGGDILGLRQSGQVQEIGVTLFLKMLEEKIEEIKENGRGRIADIRDTKIDLAIEASLPDIFFDSETDKLNFYREIESLSDIEDIEKLRQDFEKIETPLGDSTKALFDILKCKIYAKKYSISSIRKVGVNYQIDFEEMIDVETLKSFLRLDSEILFQVVDIKRLRSPTKHFSNDEKFVQYLLRMFEGKIGPKKIKIKLQ